MPYNVTPLLETQFPPTFLDTARKLGEVGAQEKVQVYLVGGPVRDLLLGKTPKDIDFAVEGAITALTARLMEATDAQVVMRSQFLTVKLRIHGTTVDLATTRREKYSSPGALPQVEIGFIEEDLTRRDFTINAMAIALSPNRFGELLDPLGGRQDLDQKLVRVLHNKSFQDDPTRILRGLRYVHRFGFHLEEETATLIHRDTSILAAISSDRVRHELELLLYEPAPEKILAQAEEFGVLQAIYSPLQWDSSLSEAIAHLREQSGYDVLLPLALLAHPLTEEEARGLAGRLNMRHEWNQVVLDMVGLRSTLSALGGEEVQPSQVETMLKRYSPVALSASLALEERPTPKKWLECYLTQLRYVHSELTGSDLLALGIPKGPRVGEVLKALHRARLDNEISSRNEEVGLVKKWIV